MSAAHPIRNLNELEELKKYYLEEKPNLRNYAMISTGINTALRISDILTLKWKDVYDYSKDAFKRHIVLTEKKTGKQSCIAVNENLEHALSIYKEKLCKTEPEQYIFCGRKPNQPLSRSQAFRIIQGAGEKLNLTGHISCHSLRKTFGYHAWSSGVNPVILMLIFNHSSFEITKRYLGIEQDDKDQVFLQLNL